MAVSQTTFENTLKPTSINTFENTINDYINMINSNNKAVQLEGVIGIRRCLSNDQNPPIQCVINSGIVPKLLEFLSQEEEPRFQYESAWAITNICSGETQFVNYILDLGGLEIIINLLHSDCEEVVDQAIWAIGNITGDSVHFRDICLELDCMEKILEASEKFPTSMNIIKNTMWAASNLTRGKPFPEWSKVSMVLPILYQNITTASHLEVLSDSLWCLSYISDVKIQEVIDQGCVPLLVNHLFDHNLSIITPALRSLGNLVTGNDAQTNEILSCPEFLPRLFQLTSSPKKTLRKEAFWTISNITAGNPQQIESILQNPEYLKALKSAVWKETIDVATEASWAINNMISGSTSEQLSRIIKEYALLETFGMILQNPKPAIKAHCLDGMLMILRHGEENQENIYSPYFKKLGLVEKIQGFISCKKLGAKASKILKCFDKVKDQNKSDESGRCSESDIEICEDKIESLEENNERED